ncbi:MAG: redoxin domain-containing protein [Cryomorphaceae bacterium]|nr:redoxin domain-containing protein [Cryomorphaceae bacterium]
MEKPVSSILVSDYSGQVIDLLQVYKGKPLLLLIYNNQCLGCTGRAVPLAYQLSKAFPAVEVLGIHTSFSKEVVTERDIMSIFTIDEPPFPIYLDQEQRVYQQFTSEGTPQWILLTSNHTVYRSIFGSQANAENRLYYALEQMC